MHRFNKKNLLLVGIVALLLTMFAIAVRPSVQTADAETGNIIHNRNVQLREAFRLAEGK
jgi:hypothetical protein